LLPKHKDFGWKWHILREYRRKIEILTIRYLLCWKFASVCRQIPTSCIQNFSNSWCCCIYTHRFHCGYCLVSYHVTAVFFCLS